MGLLEDLGKQVLSNVTGGSSSGGAANVNWVQLGLSLLNKFGGVEGLMAKFQQAGLGGLISSWVGKGQNEPASPQQITTALGEEHLNEVAAEAGTDPQTAASGLAEILPSLVDKLTPDGKSVGGDDFQQSLQSLLQGKLGDLGKLFG